MNPSTAPGLPLLIVVEGINDVHFLKTISAMLHWHHADCIDLGQLEAERKALFLPIGGSNLKEWAQRIASLHKREFHLYDREQEPETTERRHVIEAINQRPGCSARLTGKRAMENYLHPSAILEACDIELHITDDTDVTHLLAHQLLASRGRPLWHQLPSKSQRRLNEKVKKLLNIKAVASMTPELLAERDGNNEVIAWLQTIHEATRHP